LKSIVPERQSKSRHYSTSSIGLAGMGMSSASYREGRDIGIVV